MTVLICRGLKNVSAVSIYFLPRDFKRSFPWFNEIFDDNNNNSNNIYAYSLVSNAVQWTS